MFTISFVDLPPLSKEPLSHQRKQAGSARGRIVIGGFTEHFESSLDFWRASDYREHWRAAVSRLARGAEKTALITEMHDPAAANFIVWWPLYRIDDAVFVQNQLLFLSSLPEPFSAEAMDRFVAARRVVNDEGDRISEWSAPLRHFEAFLSGGSTG